MLTTDVNVLVYAHRQETTDHLRYKEWLERTVNSEQAFGVVDLVLSGFVRVVTHSRIFSKPSTADQAIAFVEALRTASNCVVLKPGPRHWGIFKKMCTELSLKGNLVPDAFLAALAIESGAEWITTDRDYSRFPGLNWRHPLES